MQRHRQHGQADEHAQSCPGAVGRGQDVAGEDVGQGEGRHEEHGREGEARALGRALRLLRRRCDRVGLAACAGCLQIYPRPLQQRRRDDGQHAHGRKGQGERGIQACRQAEKGLEHVGGQEERGHAPKVEPCVQLDPGHPQQAGDDAAHKAVDEVCERRQPGYAPEYDKAFDRGLGHEGPGAGPHETAMRGEPLEPRGEQGDREKGRGLKAALGYERQVSQRGGGEVPAHEALQGDEAQQRREPHDEGKRPAHVAVVSVFHIHPLALTDRFTNSTRSFNRKVEKTRTNAWAISILLNPDLPGARRYECDRPSGPVAGLPPMLAKLPSKGRAP